MEKTVTRFVLADWDGIEFYHKTQEWFPFMDLRASLNRHRHAIALVAEIEESDDQAIQALLDDAERSSVNGICPEDKYHNYAEALNILKVKAKKITLLHHTKAYKRSLDLIPNLELDPYSD